MFSTLSGRHSQRNGKYDLENINFSGVAHKSFDRCTQKYQPATSERNEYMKYTKVIRINNRIIVWSISIWINAHYLSVGCAMLLLVLVCVCVCIRGHTFALFWTPRLSNFDRVQPVDSFVVGFRFIVARPVLKLFSLSLLLALSASVPPCCPLPRC